MAPKPRTRTRTRTKTNGEDDGTRTRTRTRTRTQTEDHHHGGHHRMLGNHESKRVLNDGGEFVAPPLRIRKKIELHTHEAS